MLGTSESLPLADFGLVLTILIPTRTRVHDVRRCAQAFVQQVEEGSLGGSVEVLVVDNCSTDATAAVIQKFARQHACLRYERHLVARDTAETSLFHAIPFARGRWIWSFGDDDLPTDGAVSWLVSHLIRDAPSLVLANCVIHVPYSDSKVAYFENEEAVEYYSQGLGLFKKYGLVSATTTISCLVFERRSFQLGAAVRLACVSQIYSHSAAMLVSFHDRPATFVGRALCVYRQNTIVEETERFGAYCRSRGLLLEELFTGSVTALAEEIRRCVGISIREIAHFEEPEFSKSDARVVCGTLLSFVARFADDRLAALNNRRAELALRSDLRIILGVTVFIWKAGLRRQAGRYIGRAALVLLTVLRGRVTRTVSRHL